MSRFRFAHTSPRLALTGALLTAFALGGCSSIDRLSQIGEQPKLAAIENPTTQPGYKPVQMPMPKPEVASYNANSLWRNGSRAFFKDQRARQEHGQPAEHEDGGQAEEVLAFAPILCQISPLKSKGNIVKRKRR